MKGCLTKVLIALVLLHQPAQAQTRDVSLLRMPSWPRAAGLADIGAATNLPEGLFYNPALAGAVNAIAGSAHFFGSDSMLTTVVAGLTTGAANVGVAMQVLRADLVPSGYSLTTATSLGASLRLKGIRWGAALKHLQLVEGAIKDDGVVVDLGAQRQIGVFSTGLAVQNLGTDLNLAGEDIELPTKVTLAAEGQGLPIGAFVDFGATAAIAVDRDGEVLPAIGGQVLYTPLDGWTFTARAGVRRPAPSSNMRPVTGGLAITLDRLTIDYAIEAVKRGPTVHRIGARLR